MANSPVILVTRPQKEGNEFAGILAGKGYVVLQAPMLEIVAADFQKPDFVNFQALIFTSLNGVKSFSEKNERT